VETTLRSTGEAVAIAPDLPTVLIGERINPTGRRRLAAALAEGNLDLVRTEAEAQVAAGADVLDVNVGAAGIDEMSLLPQAVRTVMDTVGVPVCIDTANPQALRAALRTHAELAPEGTPLVNSVTGEEPRLNAVLPLVAEFGAAVVGLTMDDGGIPSTAEERLAVACRIVERAEGFGIPRHRVIIDCLALAVGADSAAASVCLQAVRLVREELGLNLTLGASNASFGLPDRDAVSCAFLAMSIQSGVNCPIVDAAKVRPTILATDLLLGRDPFARRYIRAYRERQKSRQ
jgi:5-methyltetrahydrofolate--homocysteine methyltransferase